MPWFRSLTGLKKVQIIQKLQPERHRASGYIVGSLLFAKNHSSIYWTTGVKLKIKSVSNATDLLVLQLPSKVVHIVFKWQQNVQPVLLLLTKTIKTFYYFIFI